uniref:Ig-like domain-containing protein n=1 Tax=Anopheles epiroticus TaxID=199890 RepID=A0A182PQZ5_9DIPT
MTGKSVKSSEIQAVEGRKISLPCPLSAPSRDKVYMVLWFKDDAGIPLYRRFLKLLLSLSDTVERYSVANMTGRAGRPLKMSSKSRRLKDGPDDGASTEREESFHSFLPIPTATQRAYGLSLG